MACPPGAFDLEPLDIVISERPANIRSFAYMYKSFLMKFAFHLHIIYKTVLRRVEDVKARL